MFNQYTSVVEPKLETKFEGGWTTTLISFEILFYSFAILYRYIFSPPRPRFLYFIFTLLKVRSAAAQTALWGGPVPRNKLGTSVAEPENTKLLT